MRLFNNIVMWSLALTMSLLVLSCHHDDKEQKEVEVKLNIKTPVVTSNATSQFIVVNTPGEWKISSNQGWASVEPSTGIGSYSKIVLSCEENTSDESRTAIITLSAAGTNVDVTIVQAGVGGGIIDPDDPDNDKTHLTYGWLELPAFKSGTYKFVTHEFASSGRSGRSFSLLWSKADLVALWVAYPLNNALIASGSRTNYWGMDPKLSSEEQPILYSGYTSGYDRGHQLPSADRLSYNDNVKTFYFSNMTPQLSSLNSNLWASVEGQVRTWASKSDTLYVVTGCVVTGSNKKVYDNNGKSVTVPVAYYKAVLRYMNGSTIGHSGYMALGLYLEHKAYSEKKLTKAMTMSIDELESKLNIDLFPNLEKKVGEATAATIEAEKPANISWWWN